MSDSSSPNSVRSSATIETLKARAKIAKRIRAFFDDRGFFEVDTPVLSHDIVVDRYLEPINVAGDSVGAAAVKGKTLWLQTSPEFAMKRLLASGADAIYQIAHAFRSGERGTRHNPEFSMLEWYRVGDDMNAGMQLLGEFAESILGTDKPELITYANAFKKYAGCDGLTEIVDELRAAAEKYELDFSAIRESTEIDQWRNLILSLVVEPKLGKARPEIVYDWPASQSALAKVRNDETPAVAERFELYVNGVELANGYHELLDADELLQRNQLVNRQRVVDGKSKLPEESFLIQAMRHGFPQCSGVALGIDRLIMLAQNKQLIDEVIPFPIEKC